MASPVNGGASSSQVQVRAFDDAGPDGVLHFQLLKLSRNQVPPGHPPPSSHSQQSQQRDCFSSSHSS